MTGPVLGLVPRLGRGPGEVGEEVVEHAVQSRVVGRGEPGGAHAFVAPVRRLMVGGQLLQRPALITQRTPDALEQAAHITRGHLGRNAVTDGPRRERGQISEMGGQRPRQGGEHVERRLVPDRQRPAQAREEGLHRRMGRARHRDGVALTNGGQRDGPHQRSTGAQDPAQLVVTDPGHQVHHDRAVVHAQSRQRLVPVTRTHSDDHQLGPVHHLLVAGTHPHVVITSGQLGGRTGATGRQEHLERLTGPLAQARHDGPADLPDPDDADTPHAHCLAHAAHPTQTPAPAIRQHRSSPAQPRTAPAAKT